MTNMERNENVDAAPRATWREWFGLGTLTLAVFMLATDATVLFLAMPSIAADLAPSSTQMLWIIHIGELLTVGFVLTMGRLGDKIGRRRLLIIGVSVYGLANLIAAFSTSAWVLIATRALIGVAAATLMPSTMSLLRNMFPDAKQFSVAIAINLSAFSAGMALGPPMGGLLLDYFWWGAVFLINVPVAIGLLATSPLLPEYRNKEAKRMDVSSILLSSGALVALVFGLQEMANNGFDMLYGGSVVIGIALGMLFIKRQRNTKDPIMDLRMFKIPTFNVSVIVLTLMMLTTSAADMFFAQHLQAVLGFSATKAGLLLIIPAILSMAGTLISPVLTRWMRPAYAMVSGLIIATVGSLLIVFTVHDAGALILIMGVALLGFGGGPAMTISSEQIVSSVPPERAGTASAMSDVSSGLGFALGIAFIGSLGMLVYRGALANTLPSEVPTHITNAAMESIGAAVVTAEGFPEMLQAAQSSFSVAIQSIFGITTIGLFAIMTLIIWKLRHLRNEDTASNEDGTPINEEKFKSEEFTKEQKATSWE